MNLIDLLVVAGISTMTAASLLGFLWFFVVPKVAAGFAKGIFDQIGASLKGKDMQEKSVVARLDKNLMKHVSKDLLSPSSPMGAILAFLPETRDYIEEHPEQITGLINLGIAIPNLLEQGNKLLEFVQGQQKKDPASDFYNLK